MPFCTPAVEGKSLRIHAIAFEVFSSSGYILNKSENATLQSSIFCLKVLDKDYLLKLNNVSQTSSKRFVETPPICLVERATLPKTILSKEPHRRIIVSLKMV